MAMEIVNVESAGIASMDGKSILMAVLTKDDRGQFAVYCGIVPQSRDMSERTRFANWVAFSGTKQSYEKSKQYFRGIKPEEYRS
jgi:hypothetical protein